MPNPKLYPPTDAILKITHIKPRARKYLALVETHMVETESYLVSPHTHGVLMDSFSHSLAGVSYIKSDTLNPESENAVVKMASAKPHITNEMKAYIESHRALLNSFFTLTVVFPVPTPSSSSKKNSVRDLC